MYCWGFDEQGQLGMNAIIDGMTDDKKATKMALSMISTCVITGTEANPSKFATCVGKGFTSENVVSTTIDLVNDVLKLTAGSDHFCALLVGDTAKCWGANNAGQLGIGSNDFIPRHETAVDVLVSPGASILSGITDINAGYLSTCLVANESPMCFGNNRSYQLGIANGGANVLYPTVVSSAQITGKTLVSIHVGEQTGHAIYNDDSIYSMGTNYGGALGDGSIVSFRNVVGDVSGATIPQMNFSSATIDQSSSPSSIPSLLPSSSPVTSPSSRPSSLSSEIPSLRDSQSPSSSVSAKPSINLSSGPSESPSESPSMSSDKPSSSPTLLPSDTPSLLHSSGPSFSPSLLPSDTPSAQHSSSPSLLPSDTPSLLHSSEPSSIPSALPSLGPSSNPSQDPNLLGDENSHITFNNVDFGSTNSIKGIKVTYANGVQNGFGSVEIKLGDASGTTLAQFSPSGTRSCTLLIPFDNTVQLSGVNSLTFATSETTAVMHLISYELIDLSERFAPFTTIDATEVSNQNGIRAVGVVGYFDNGDYFTYSPIDFGLGANSIKITYSKNNTRGRLEIRKGDVNGEVIGNYLPASTGGWENYITVDIPITTTFGINELTFIARTDGLAHYLINLKSFQLSPVSSGYICLDPTARTHTSSVQAAASAQTGANLVSIQCGAQQNAVASMSRNANLFIGGTDAVNEGTWVLPEGNAVAYSNWYPGEPSNIATNGDPEHCMIIRLDGFWNDVTCGASWGSIFQSTFDISGLQCTPYVGCEDTVKIVENGIQTSDTRLRNTNLVTQSDTAGAYLNVPGSTTATSADNWNVYNLPIGANDDFVMLAKLKVDGSRSAASFFINDLDNFGFDGSSNQIFTHSNSAFITDFVQSNKGTHNDNLFYFKVERKLGTIKFYINEEEVASTASYNVAISRFFWRPWRADLKIYDWIVSSPSLLDFSSIDQAGYVCLQTQQKTYSDSVQAAKSAQTGANLVSIRCSEQQAKVNLLSLGASSWIGANDINTDYAWILADGHAMTYSNWKANEPNNAGTGGEDCVVVGSDGLWVDGPCDSTAEAVYESPYPISGLSCEQYAECTTNVALSGTATESSTAYDRPASRAIDGNTASNFDSGSVTHTSEETDPWWKVQLAQEYSISQVIVYNRNESFGDNESLKARLNAFRMTVLLNEVEVFRYDDSAPLANVVTSIVVPSNVIGNAVKIQLFGNTRVISLAEVEVEGLCLNWAQVGASIVGKAANDYFGNSMSLSADGRTVAVGAYGNDDDGNLAGQNRIFRLSHDGLWNPLGQDLNGQAAGHESGRTIALSPDGSTVAIADPLKSSNGFSNNGDVRIYRFNESSSIWELLGTNIEGQGDNYRFGWEKGRGMALSEDGNTIALGAWYYSSLSTVVDKGSVYVYRLTNGSWSLFGMSSSLLGQQDKDWFGYSVALSYDGETLAVGAPKNVNTGNVNSESYESGHVSVYRISSGSWQQLGSNLEGEGGGNAFGGSVSLSSDGNTVAIGGALNGGSVEVTGNGLSQSGHVRVLHYLSGSWQMLGEDIDGEAAYDYSGFSVALSSDGETVVIGATQNDGNGDKSGHARVYRYSNGSTWKKIGDDIDGQGAGDHFGRAVSISANGETVAISSRGSAGYVLVYDLFGNCS